MILPKPEGNNGKGKLPPCKDCGANKNHHSMGWTTELDKDWNPVKIRICSSCKTKRLFKQTQKLPYYLKPSPTLREELARRKRRRELKEEYEGVISDDLEDESENDPR